MTITAKIITDSISNNIRLTTFQLRYPRFIHGEYMTHRVFSRNASSSRAIPVKKLISDIIEDTAMPIHWGKNRPGMQANEEHYDLLQINDENLSREEAWLKARDSAIEIATQFMHAGYHKQIVNRILEPFSHISVVCTATDFNNFFALRSHEDAQPEIKCLSDKMIEELANSIPNQLETGMWHLPYVLESENYLPLETKRKISVARCARVSYLRHDGTTPDITKDVELHDVLVVSRPLHASPAEHQATPDTLTNNNWDNPAKHGNLRGYIQYRKTLPFEYVA
jgi:thymidylate synthase ThyX